MSASIQAISVGRGATLMAEDDGYRFAVPSAIGKRPVSTLQDPQAIELQPMGLEGDEQIDRTVHGGLDQAVYLYPIEHLEFWRTVLSQAQSPVTVGPGLVGENLLISGLRETQVWVGDRLQIGDVELLVTRPRGPCYKLNAVLQTKHAVKLMVQSGYTGFYARVVHPGKLAAGQDITVIAGERTVTIEQAHRLMHAPKRRL